MEDCKKKKKVADTQQQPLNTSGHMWEVQFAVRWITRCKLQEELNLSTSFRV